MTIAIDLQIRTSATRPGRPLWAQSFGPLGQSTPTTGELRIRTDGVPPSWLGPVLERLRELGQLPENWDTRGGRRLDAHDAQAVLSFLFRVMQDQTPVPWIGLLGTGGLQLTWRTDDLEVEAVFDHARGERIVLFDEADEEREIPIRHNWAEIAEVVGRLSSLEFLPA